MSFDPALLSDPRTVSIGRLAPHSDHRWFASLEEEHRGASSYERSLDGPWKFAYARNPASAPRGFADPAFDISTWDDIQVPGHIQLQGYDRPQYANTQYPWDGHEDVTPPCVPTRFNPTACYVKDVVLDPVAPGERVTVTFEGAETGLAAWINGHFLGYAEDSFTPSEFDLTDYLTEGRNRLAVKVFKWTSASWLEDQDFFRFSGLFRSVILRTLPPAHARDIRASVHVAEDLTSAVITVQVDLEGNGSVTATFNGQPMEPVGSSGFQTTVDQPRLWSAEDPYLYDVRLEVRDESGKPVEYIPLRVGVRRFGIEDGLIKINGRRLVFLGVNRHEFGMNGRVMTREETEADLIALKRAGVNAIRTSHYPNNSFFYDLADKYGFYVVDEMNLETHGLWERGIEVADAIPGDRPEWLPALLDRAANLYQRDKNHPSVVIWSCGNESYGGTDILAVANYFRTHDSRPVHYEGVFQDPRYPQTTDIRSEMYTPAAEVERRLQQHRDKPMILCEYAHAMGNSFGAVDRYLDLADREPLFQGGFIWDFADQAIQMTDRYGNRFFAYGGDHGEAPHDNDFCGNGIFFADRSPTPQMQEVKYLYQGIRATVTEDTVTVTNRYDFTSTDRFDCVVTVKAEGHELARATLATAVAPGERATYPLPITLPSAPGEYTIDVTFQLPETTPWAPAGYPVSAEQAVIVVPPSSLDPAPRLHLPSLTVVDGTHNIGVHGTDFSALFSRLYGGLQSYQHRGRNLLQSIPMPNFWHAPTSNELGWNAPFEGGQWLLASRYAKFEPGPDNPTLAMRDGNAVVTYRYLLPTSPQCSCIVEYEVHGNGRVDVTQSLADARGLADLPEFGMLFKVDADLSTLTWYGEGPAESYVDRRLGARVDVYQQPVSDQLTQYLLPQEAGNHTGVRWAEVTDDGGVGLRFSAAVPMEFSALPWSPFEIESAAHHHELPPVHHTFIRPALARRGVGGDDSWGARPHPEFVIDPGAALFHFSFQAVP